MPDLAHLDNPWVLSAPAAVSKHPSRVMIFSPSQRSISGILAYLIRMPPINSSVLFVLAADALKGWSLQEMGGTWGDSLIK